MSPRRTVLAGVVAVVALVAVAALVFGVGEVDDGPLAAGTLDLDGRAVLIVDGSREELEAGRHRLSDGDVVQLVEGSGVLALGGAAALELREGRGGASDSEVEVGEPVELLGGDALLAAPTAASVVVGVAEVGLASGAARLSRTTGASVAVYEGLVGLTSGGRSLPDGVPALRQATVATLGAVPARPEPLDYDPDSPDPWDLRYLGSAIELGESLEARSIGFTSSLGDGGADDGGFLVDVLPALGDESAFGPGLLDDAQTPGELLVGAAIVLAGDEGGFADRWRSTFSFRNQGARWGIVALDQGVVEDPLLETVDDAIADAPLLFSPESLALAATDSGPFADAGSADGDGVENPTTPVPPAPEDVSPPAPSPLDPVVEPLDPVVEPLDPVVEPLDPVVEPLDPVVGPLAPVLDPVGEALEPAVAPLAPVVEPLAPLLDPVEELFSGILGGQEDTADAVLTDAVGSLLG